MIEQPSDFAVQVLAGPASRWTWQVVAADGEVALVGVTAARASAFDQAELFRRHLSRTAARLARRLS